MTQQWTGTASYYADKFEGRKTSSGEIFKQNKLTAAHKTLPFGTLVKVTNLSNDSVVIVKINDRLPPSSSRMIDLSRKAAEQLNFIRKGLTKVSMERVLADSVLADYKLWRKNEITLSCGVDSSIVYVEREKLIAVDTSKIKKNISSYFRDLAWNFYCGYVIHQNTDKTLAEWNLRQSISYYQTLIEDFTSQKSDQHNYLFCLFLSSECEKANILYETYIKDAPESEKEELLRMKSKYCPH